MQVTRAFTAVRPVRSAVAPAPQRAAVVVRAKPTKVSDFSGLSNEELLKKADDLKFDLARVKWMQRTRGDEMTPGQQPQPDPEKVPKGHLNKHFRRQVAQVLTLLRQRQIADGIDRRTAKSLEKRAALANGLLQKAAQAK